MWEHWWRSKGGLDNLNQPTIGSTIVVPIAFVTPVVFYKYRAETQII